MLNIIKQLKISSDFNHLEQSLKQNKNCSIFGLNFGEKTWLLNSLDKKVIYLSTSMEVSEKVYNQIKCFDRNVQLVAFPKVDPTFSLIQDKESDYKLLSVLTDICLNRLDFLISTPELLIKRLPDKQTFLKHIISIQKGVDYKLEDVVNSLIDSGYKRVDVIDKKGEFSLKGDVLTVFAVNNDFVIRAEFFDTEVEKLALLNVENFATIKVIERVDISPCSIILDINKEQVLEKLKKSVLSESKKLSLDAQNKLSSIYEQVEQKLYREDYSNLSNFLAPFLDNNSFITDYYNHSDCLVAFDEAKQCYESISNAYFNLDNSIKNLKESGELLSEHKFTLPDRDNLPYLSKQLVSFQVITTANRLFNPDSVFSFQCEAVTNYIGNLQLLLDSVKYYDNKFYTTCIFVESASKAVELQELFKKNKLECKIINRTQDVEAQKINVITKKINYGFCLPKEKLLFIGTAELEGKKALKLNDKSNKKKNPFFALPKVGDYVVHETHGIGKCLGVQKLKFSDYEKEVIVIEYDKGDKLFLPTEQIGLISSYVSEGKAPRLNKLGTSEFEKTKEKVKKALKDMAFDLVELYAQRQKLSGYAYEDSNNMCKIFEETFPYEETEDQKQAIEDTLNDMKSGKIMDRLVCGDVGYGKTEVALRAIFLAVLNGKQVAFLAPTTILSEQHYNTCIARLSQFGINVKVVNRFRTNKEVKNILEELKDGKVDVICGTHRLLSKDVIFKNLGLLVLDEEQRFGVQDKEKIKTIKKNVDVLTLSATPIPRTLHMSLVGIRDISIIETAPFNRLPVQTSVTEFSESLIKDAIFRELNRDGQVLIVYNRVDTIYQFATKLRDLVDNPDITISVAHGQMAERELETEIMNLYNGKTKILVATTLIENGVDLPNANTLIVTNADMLGLSQLYQLRGRVGRGGNLGYAYFLYDNEKVLSETAYKRLDTIMEYTELGSGFKIAMRDLEIRGCGNVMGKEQHGNMEKVGYDMYCKLLNQAVLEIKGKKQLEESGNVKLDIALNSFIPDFYIKDVDARMNIYNKLMEVNSPEKQISVLEEIANIYGAVPDEIRNFSLVTFIRNLATKARIIIVRITKETFSLKFESEIKVDEERLVKSARKAGIKFSITHGINAVVDFENLYSVKQNAEKLIQILLDYTQE